MWMIRFPIGALSSYNRPIQLLSILSSFQIDAYKKYKRQNKKECHPWEINSWLVPVLISFYCQMPNLCRYFPKKIYGLNRVLPLLPAFRKTGLVCKADLTWTWKRWLNFPCKKCRRGWAVWWCDSIDAGYRFSACQPMCLYRKNRTENIRRGIPQDFLSIIGNSMPTVLYFCFLPHLKNSRRQLDNIPIEDDVFIISKNAIPRPSLPASHLNELKRKLFIYSAGKYRMEILPKKIKVRERHFLKGKELVVSCLRRRIYLP